MIVTTKTGDQGTTEIQGGRISKADPLIEVLGDLDELSAECLVLASGFSGYRKSMKQIVTQLSAASAMLSGYGEADLGRFSGIGGSCRKLERPIRPWASI